MDFTFYHAADIHLGGRFSAVAAHAEAAAQAFAGAQGRALARLVDHAIADRAAFLLLSGDLFDRELRDLGVGLDATRAFRRLKEAGVRTFLIKGNHDAESLVTSRAVYGDVAHVFAAGDPETVEIPELGVAIHGWSYPDRHVTENVARRFPPPLPGLLNIGMLHTNAAGGEGEAARYAPCTPEDLAKTGYDYWALGHVHTGQNLMEGGGGAPWIVFPGSLQGLSPREPGPRGGLAVRVSGGRLQAPQFRACDVARFASANVDLTGCETPEEAAAAQDRALAAAWAGAEGRPLSLRLALVGATKQHEALSAASPEERLREAGLRAAKFGDAFWVEKVAVRTTPPTGGGPLSLDAEFAALLHEAAAEPETVALLAKEMAQLAGRGPRAGFDWERDAAAFLAEAAQGLAPAGPAEEERD